MAGRSGGYRPLLRRSASGSRGWRRGWDPWWGSGSASSDNPPDDSISPRTIRKMQSCLARMLGPWVPQSGSLGPKTRRAIKAFQRRQQLPVTGYPDETTISALKESCTSEAPSKTPRPGADDGPGPQQGAEDSPQEFFLGSLFKMPVEVSRIQAAAPLSASGCNQDRCTSTYIAWMQQSLNQLGSKLAITRILDRNTINAINVFKKQNGIPYKEYYASPRLEQALVSAGAAPPPSVRKLPCGPTPANQLLPLLRQYAPDIAPEYLLGWMSVESGMKLGDLTRICERGYFQVHPEESAELKLDHDRLSVDPAYSVQGGLRLVRRYAAGADRLASQFGFGKTGDLYWGLVKLAHWIPSAPTRIVQKMHQSGASLTSWDSIRQFIQSNPSFSLGGWNPAAGIKSVDNYLNKVASWRAILAGKK
jgi:peptidoglycan hydrolase-like protein with peptidoglycan-binding domain